MDAYAKGAHPYIMGNFAGHGMGRHESGDVDWFAKSDLTALSDLLGDQNYFMGDTATSIDATVYAFIAETIYVPFENATKEYALSCQNLVDFASRMKEAYYP